MKIYIELLIILLLLSMFLFWKIWYKWSKRRLIKKYKPENDKGRKGTSGKELGIGKTTISYDEHEQHEGREFLQDTSVDDVGKNINSNRKVSFFRRR